MLSSFFNFEGYFYENSATTAQCSIKPPNLVSIENF